MKGLAGTPITCHHFTTPLLTGSQPPAVPGQDLPPPRGASLPCTPRGMGLSGSPRAVGKEPWGRGIPSAWQLPQAQPSRVSALLRVLKAAPSPACNQGGCIHPQQPSPGPSAPHWCCPCAGIVPGVLCVPCGCLGGSSAPSPPLWWH